MDCSLPGSPVHGIFQARVLEWVAISFSRGSSHPGIESGSPALQADALPSEPPGKPLCPHLMFILQYPASPVLHLWRYSWIPSPMAETEIPFLTFPSICACSVLSDSFTTPWIVTHQAPLSMEFSRQEYWSGLPFPSPGDLPYPGIKPGSPALAGGFCTTEPSGKL